MQYTEHGHEVGNALDISLQLMTTTQAHVVTVKQQPYSWKPKGVHAFLLQAIWDGIFASLLTASCPLPWRLTPRTP